MKRIFDSVGTFLTAQKDHKQRMAVFGLLAAFVLLGVVLGLRMYGQALNYKTEALECSFELHEHDDGCREDGEYICGYADYVVHEHDGRCFDKDGELVCSLPEIEEHEHDEACWETKRVLVCDIKASSSGSAKKAASSGNSGEPACGLDEHQHSDDCWSGGGSGCDIEEHSHGDGCYEESFVCTKDEHQHSGDCDEETQVLSCSGGHSHSEGCYEDGELACGEEPHSHDDSCYTTETRRICGQSEHTHGDGCYERRLACDRTEHTHGDACKADDAELVCEKAVHTHSGECFPADDEELEEEVPGHVHDDGCFETEDVLTCGELELHEHDEDGCFDDDGNLICGQIELLVHQHDDSCFTERDADPDEIVHEHDETCYDEDGNLICGKGDAADVPEEKHFHTEDCYEYGDLVCGYPAEHDHDADCFDEDGNLICGYGPAIEQDDDHEHDAKCYDVFGRLKCGHKNCKDHIHGESCYDEDGGLICGYEIREAMAGSLYYKGDGFEMSVEYPEDAGIPEDAKLEAGLFRIREADEKLMLDNVEDENAVAAGTLKFAIYAMDGDKRIDIAPESDIKAIIRFAQVNGVPEGSQSLIGWLHDGDITGLDSSDLSDRAIEFTTGHTGRFAIGFIPSDGGHEIEDNDGILHILLADTFDAEAGGFKFRIRIDGKGKVGVVPEKTDDGEDAEKETVEIGVSGEDDGIDPADGAVHISDMAGEEDEPVEPDIINSDTDPDTGSEE